MKKALIDTSILFPALVDSHPNHKLCKRMFNRIKQSYDVVVLNTHLAAELYTNLTRFPKSKIHPKVAASIIRKLRENMKVVDLTMDDYLLAVDRCAEKGLISGVVYDALHLQAAIKVQASVLYTANLRDFARLMDGTIEVELKGLDV